jgi:ubiquitin-protein ligase E3 D
VPQSRLALGETHTLKFIPILCQSCRTEIGVYNVLATFVTLFKWQVSCKTTITSPNIPPSSLQCLAATLTSNISRYASTKSVIMPHGLLSKDEIERGPDSSLHLWVLNPRLIYTSSEVNGRREAMKVLYREIDYEEGIKMIETVSSEVQEVSTSASMIESVRSGLQQSTESLPDDARRFKDWRVGLLDRWS